MRNMRPAETEKFIKKKARRVRIQVDDDFNSTEADDKNWFDDPKFEPKPDPEP